MLCGKHIRVEKSTCVALMFEIQCSSVAPLVTKVSLAVVLKGWKSGLVYYLVRLLRTTRTLIGIHTKTSASALGGGRCSKLADLSVLDHERVGYRVQRQIFSTVIHCSVVALIYANSQARELRYRHMRLLFFPARCGFTEFQRAKAQK